MTSRKPVNPVLKIPFIYIVFGASWVLGGDWLLSLGRFSEDTIHTIQSVKGTLFVVLSAALICLLVWLNQRDEKRLSALVTQRDEHFRQALGNVREAAFDYDLDRSLLHWSYGMRELLGDVNQTALTNIEQFRTHIHSDDVERVLAAFQRAREKNSKDFTLDFRVITRTGKPLWVQIEAATMKSVQDKPARLVGVMRDITDRKHFEMDLIASNRALTALSEGNREIVQATDITALCQRICKLLVSRAGYKTAWIGRAEDGEILTPFASEGAAAGYFEIEPTRFNSLQAHYSPITLAAASGTSTVCTIDDLGGDFLLWRKQARNQGYSGCFAVQVQLPACGNKPQSVFGTLAILVGNGESFDEREQLILETLGRDLGFALSVLINTTEAEAVRFAGLKAEMRLNHVLADTVAALSATIERRDPASSGHENNAVKMAVALGTRMGLNSDQLRGLEVSALLHDVGKVAISPDILSKQGKLTESELAIIRQHPQTGYEILAGIDFPWPVKDVVLQHHERMDGSGYPHGLKGNEICLEARIMAVVDVMESLISPRPYRPAHSIAEALAVLHEPSKFDAQVVAILTEMLREGRLPLAA